MQSSSLTASSAASRNGVGGFCTGSACYGLRCLAPVTSEDRLTGTRLNILTYQMRWLVTAQAAYRQRTTGSPSPQRPPAGEETIPLAA